MEIWMEFIQKIGFPIVISFYLLHRVEMRLQAIHEALLTLTTQSTQIRQQ